MNDHVKCLDSTCPIHGYRSRSDQTVDPWDAFPLVCWIYPPDLSGYIYILAW